MWVTGFGL
ncbi:hypothetical protein RLOC_00004553 [Lonchura striata]|uniref:Uncharacterized protein n=1 Tax=Lonchura striata TaxID=40157 RepID=A0A218V9B8_9PASE|nr:hypothetical protein RLOC_00004553 [Lonchura striata domestica]